MKLRMNPVCEKLRRYLNRNADDISSVDEICTKLGIDVSEKTKIYHCLVYWRKKFAEFYDVLNTKGVLQGDPYQKWLLAVKDFEAMYGIQPLFYDKERKEYFVPNFHEKEEISKQRIIHWVKSGKSVMDEMATFEETFVLTGKNPLEITGDLKMITEKILDGADAPRCNFCGQNIQYNWVSCPSCGNPL